MTKNIQKNGYSESNKSSKLWLQTSNYSALMTLVNNNIVAPILSKSSGVPKSVVVSGGGVKDSSAVVNGNVTFSRLIPMDASETKISINMRYDMRVDSSGKVRDPVTGEMKDTVFVARTVEDSLFTYSFTIRRSANAPDNWASSQNLDADCKNSKPTLELRYGGSTLDAAHPVKGNMEILQIVFDNHDGSLDYGDYVIVQVRNANAGVSDMESFTLNRGADGTWTYQFPREVGKPAVHGDGRLQHAEPQDSIILVFRNPEIPLDTIRVSVPYVSNEIASTPRP